MDLGYSQIMRQYSVVQITVFLQCFLVLPAYSSLILRFEAYFMTTWCSWFSIRLSFTPMAETVLLLAATPLLELLPQAWTLSPIQKNFGKGFKTEKVTQLFTSPHIFSTRSLAYWEQGLPPLLFNLTPQPRGLDHCVPTGTRGMPSQADWITSPRSTQVSIGTKYKH